MGAPFTSTVWRPVPIGSAWSGAAAPSNQISVMTAVQMRVAPFMFHALACDAFAERTRFHIRGHVGHQGVPHGEAYALSRRPVALLDHPMDAGGDRRTLRHPPLELEQRR